MDRTNRTKFAILGILSSGPSSGYDIKKFCEEVLAYFWHESYGQIYPLLRSLESEGLIRKDKKGTAKGDRRIPYAITASGKKELQEWLSKPFSEHPPRNELLLKVFFSNLVGPVPVIAQVQAYLDAQKRLQGALKEALSGIEEQTEYTEQMVYWKMTVKLGMRLCNARVAWCQETLLELEELKEKGKSV